MPLTFCGYCRAPMTASQVERPADPDRCPCGLRAVTRLPAGVLVHRDGCSGHDCDCGAALYEPEHVHDFQPVVYRPESPPYLETLRGYRCACGGWQPFPTSVFDAAAGLRAALRRYREAYPIPWTTEEPE